MAADQTLTVSGYTKTEDDGQLAITTSAKEWAIIDPGATPALVTDLHMQVWATVAWMLSTEAADGAFIPVAANEKVTIKIRSGTSFWLKGSVSSGTAYTWRVG